MPKQITTTLQMEYWYGNPHKRKEGKEKKKIKKEKKRKRKSPPMPIQKCLTAALLYGIS